MDNDVTEARQRIALAAFRLFGERGYSCTSIQDIADAAEVRKAMVYYYFQSKEGLYQTLVTESAAGMRDMLTQVVLGDDGDPRSEHKSAVEMLEAVAELLIGLARDNRDSVRFFLSHMFAADADRPACSFEENEHAPPRMLQQIATRGVRRGELRGDPSDLTRLLLGGIQVSIIRYVRLPDQEELSPGLGRRLVRALLRGFAGDGAHASDKAERADKPEKKNEKSERAGKPEKPGKPGKPEKPDKADKADKADKNDRPGRNERAERGVSGSGGKRPANKPGNGRGNGRGTGSSGKRATPASGARAKKSAASSPPSSRSTSRS
jgi:AcrR family transcriptional regulator